MSVIQFSINGEPVAVAGLHPTTTLLQYLRVHRHLTGTKEGCAEGDCGACTVVVGETADGGARWRAVNACILFLPTLHGRAVLTIEGLSRPEEGLHPLQQAFVDHHAAQCGFCTPGFLMALAAQHLDASHAGHLSPEDVLAGNLCRCTGYRPILAAAAAARTAGVAMQAPAMPAAEGKMLDYAAAGGRFRAPRDGDELAACMAQTPEAIILSGGTDVGLWVTKALRDLDDIVWTGACADLNRIETDATEHRIGAGVRFYDAHPLLAEERPQLGEVIRRFACAQIRQAGTVVGNVVNASPIGDSSPAFLALGAKLALRKGDLRRTVALDDFFLGYRKTALQEGEFALALIVPRPKPGEIFKAMKVSKRFDQDISAVLGAFCLRLDGEVVRTARLAFGGIAAVPMRAKACEAALEGRRLDEEAIEAACAAFARTVQPIDDMRASAAYRLEAGQNLLRRLLIEVTRPEIATRVLDFAA